MDIVVQSAEDNNNDSRPFKSFYTRCIEELRARVMVDERLAKKEKRPEWALTYFNYDWVTLMNTRASVELGGWDPMIGYYVSVVEMDEGGGGGLIR